MTNLPFDLLKANHWFAVECNNQTWDLLDAKTRTAEQTEELLHMAHAARFHWKQSGTGVHVLRADVLLATAYGIVGRSENALIYATSANQLLDQTEDVTSFDRASVTGAFALALQVAGQGAEATEMWGQFEHDLSHIEEADDRNVLEQLYQRGPKD